MGENKDLDPVSTVWAKLLAEIIVDWLIEALEKDKCR